jgi:hypothetical protein
VNPTIEMMNARSCTRRAVFGRASRTSARTSTRKYTADFAHEMNRSLVVWLERWQTPEG